MSDVAAEVLRLRERNLKLSIRAARFRDRAEAAERRERDMARELDAIRLRLREAKKGHT